MSVCGTIDSVPFVITRTKTSTGGGLTLSLDGEDVTCQSMRDTQRAVDEALGANSRILARTVFHGQHFFDGLLEASDVRFKEELSLVVPLDVWRGAASTARSAAREEAGRSAELGGMISLRRGDVEAMRGRVETAREEADARLVEYERMEAEMIGSDRSSLSLTEEETGDFDDNGGDDGGASIDRCRERLDGAARALRDAERAVGRLRFLRDEEISSLLSASRDRQEDVRAEAERVRHARGMRERAEADLRAAREGAADLRTRWGEMAAIEGSSASASPPYDDDDGNGSASFLTDSPRLVPPRVCPTCRRPLSGQEGEGAAGGDDDHDRDASSAAERVRLHTERTLADASSRVAGAEEDLFSLSEACREREATLARLESEADVAKAASTEAEIVWERRLSEAEGILGGTRDVRDRRLADLQLAADRVRRTAESRSARARRASELDRCKDAAKAAGANLDSVSREMGGLERAVEGLVRDRGEAESRSALLSRIADAFGPRGVQTFLLENAVHALRLLSQSYLDELSDGRMSLDLSLDAGERISRNANIRGPDGEWIRRPLSSLSGGQWRRCSLSLSLGFSDLVARWGGLRPSLIVLDEPLTVSR